jgi:hypothetical protein
MLNAATELGLQSRRREERVLNAAALHGRREKRVLPCHSSPGIILGRIVRHHG